MITQPTIKRLITETRKMGYGSKFHNSMDLELEDPFIRLNDTTSIQLGVLNGGMSVVSETPDGAFRFSEEFYSVKEVLEYIKSTK